jgi:acetyl esterase
MSQDQQVSSNALVVTDQSVSGRHGTIPTRHYATSHAAREAMPLIWLHGGAFAYGGLDQAESDAPARALAAAGRPVVTVDYSLVPRWSWVKAPRPGRLPGIRYPIPVEDVLDVVASVQAKAPDGKVFLGGASAGACLAAAATIRLREKGRIPEGLILFYGTFHAKLPPLSSELRSRIRGRYAFAQFRAGTVEKMNRAYAGSPEAMHRADAFPGGHDLNQFPPTLMIDADHDSLRASGEAFARELRKAHVSLDYAIPHRSRHGFLDKPGTEQFHDALHRASQWLRRCEHLSRQHPTGHNTPNP